MILWPFAVAAVVLGLLVVGAYFNRHTIEDDGPDDWMDPERERSGHLLGRKH
jgi:hypothetical protein